MYTSHFCGKIAEDFIYSVRIEPCAHSFKFCCYSPKRDIHQEINREKTTSF